MSSSEPPTLSDASTASPLVFATVAASQSLQRGREMTSDEFLELYRASMRQKHDEARRRARENAAANNPAAAPPPRFVPDAPQLPRDLPREGGGGGAGARGAVPGRQMALLAWPPFTALGRLVWMLSKIAMICAVFTQGDRHHFTVMFLVLLLLKFVGFVSSKISVRLVRPRPLAAGGGTENNSDAARHPPPPRRRSRAYRVAYIAFKSATTLVVSLFPSWRVEALEEELRFDAVLERFQPPTPQPQQQQNEEGERAPPPPLAAPAAVPAGA